MHVNLEPSVAFRFNESVENTTGIRFKFFTFDKKITVCLRLLICDEHLNVKLSANFNIHLDDGRTCYLDFKKVIKLSMGDLCIITSVGKSIIAIDTSEAHESDEIYIVSISNGVISSSNIKVNIKSILKHSLINHNVVRSNLFTAFDSQVVKKIIRDHSNNKYNSISKYYNFDNKAVGFSLLKNSLSKRPLRILTHRWHVPHQYELYKTGHSFDLINNLGSEFCQKWAYSQRPMPANAKFVDVNDLDFSSYDLVLIHFDENVLKPELTNNQVDNLWGETFKYLLKLKNLPIVAICHGTPQFYGQYHTDPGTHHLGQIIENSLIELKEALRDVYVVCNSHQAQREWGFHKSATIWHGIESRPYTIGAQDLKILTISEEALEQRPIYRGKECLDYLTENSSLIRSSLNRLNVDCHYKEGQNNLYAHAKYISYARQLSRYSVYLNPTLRSPMPRSRTESMLSGSVSVSLNNHDVDMFIDNGVDGFYSNDYDELLSQVEYLLNDERAQREMSIRSVHKANKVFAIDRYLSDWKSLLKKVL